MLNVAGTRPGCGRLTPIPDANNLPRAEGGKYAFDYLVNVRFRDHLVCHLTARTGALRTPPAHVRFWPLAARPFWSGQHAKPAVHSGHC